MSLAQSAAAPAEKIAVGRTLAEAYATLFRNLRPFAQIVIFPLALGVLLLWGWAEIYSPLFDLLVKLLGYQQAVWLNSLNPQWFVERIVGWLVLMLFLSHWLQHLTAREAGRSPTIIWLVNRTDLRILRYGLLLAIFPLTSMIVRLAVSEPTNTAETFVQNMGVFDAVFVLLVPASVAVDCLIAGRSAPIFAAAAAGQPMTLRQAWNATRNQTLRLMLLWFILYWLTFALSRPVQAVVNDLYVTLIFNVFEPGVYVGSYYRPPFVQLVSLPSALVHYAALALGSSLFLRVYRGEADAHAAILDRFD